MITKLILRTMSIFVIMIGLMFVSSCGKTADGNLTKEQQEDKENDLEATAIEDKDFTESDEDLLTVNYKEFYEQLTPFGEWVQVKPEDIGLQPKTAQLKSTGNNSTYSASVVGEKSAFASSSESVGLVYVWKPSSQLAVTSVVGQTPVYAPYSNGKWVNTNAGWYFKANTPAEETTSHYGRWVNSPTAGWLWVPGRVWAPAWVDWKQNDSYVSWAPLPPSVYLVNGTMSAPVIENSSYTIVERRYFLEPDVYKYNTVYYSNGDMILVNEMASIPGIVIVNNSVVNRGPDFNVIQTIYGRTIDLVTLQYVRNYNDVRYTNKEYVVYSPGFKRYKNKGNKKFTINEPRSYKKYGEWEDSKSKEKEYKKEVKEYNKDVKEYNKEVRKDEKEYKKEIKKVDDGKMYDNNKGKKDDNNVKGTKDNGNDKGKKQDGNNGNNKNGNDNKKGKK